MISCRSGKLRYRSRLEAQLVAARIRTAVSPSPSRAYRCHLCAGWHLTSQPLRAGAGG